MNMIANRNLNRMVSQPLDLPRTIRGDKKKSLTSFPAAKIVPLQVYPLLREDQVRVGRVAVQVEMAETAELIMNAVRLVVNVHLVPWLAFERFQGSMDILNRSYMGQAPMTGEAVIPFFETEAMGTHGSKAVYKALGLHAPSAQNVNTMYGEAYNLIVNMRRKNRSPNLAQRAMNDRTLAPAFWPEQKFAYMVPDFDQRAMDGEVPLSITNAQMPVSGIFFTDAEVPNALNVAGNYKDATGAGQTGMDLFRSTTDEIFIKASTELSTAIPQIYAELQDNGISISLSNIEVAKKTRAFAKWRERYAEHEQEWVIDMLMQALSIPDQSLKDPILVAQQTVQFQQAKRYATDSGALNESATNGIAVAQLQFAVPRIACGGILMVTAEAVPEQLYERQKDQFFYTDDVENLPNALRDFLDPEQVEVVPNDYVDVLHTDPTGAFGFAHTNHAWHGETFNIGGRFLRPVTNTTTDEARMRLWANEAIDPTLGEEFYLATTVHQKVFIDTETDPFDAVTLGELVIEGNTVFGGMVIEASDNYDEVSEEVPFDRIDKDAL